MFADDPPHKLSSLSTADGRHPPTADGRPLRILHIKDAGETSELLLGALRSGGLEPVWKQAGSAEELQAALATGPWDAVVADYSVPGWEAPAALGTVRAADPDVPFIVIAGTISHDMAVALIRATASDYVLKDDLARLAPTIEREVREAGNRRARRAADRAAAHLAAVVDSSEDAILSKTLDGTITSWNPAAERLYGWTSAEAVGRNVSFLVPPDKTGEWSRYMDLLNAGKRVGDLETVRIDREGRRIDVAMTISAVRDREGRLVGVSKAARDIRDRKRAEETLRGSEARFRALVEHSWDGVTLTDAAGIVLYATAATSRVRGHPLEEYLGRNELDFIHAEDRKSAEEAMAEAAAHPGLTVIRTFRYLHGDGSWRRIETAWTNLLADPDVGAVVLNCRDVTLAWTAEEALRTSEARYRTLTDATAAIVWDMSAAGEFESEQAGWGVFTGQSFEQCRGWGWLECIHPDDRAHTSGLWSAAVAGRTVYQVEQRVRRADGDYRHMLVRAVPVLDRGGKIREWVGTHTDLTEQKRAEAERTDLLARLTLQIERMPLAYLLTDANFRYTRWNPAAERIFGFAQAEVLGKHPFDVVVPPRSHPRVASLFARLSAGDMDAHAESENLTRDGREIACEWYNTPLFGPDGDFQGVLSLAQDVTARRQAEESLRLRDRAIQAATQGLVITDPGKPDNPIVYFSPGCERMTGYTAAEAIGRNCRFLQGKDTDLAAMAQLRQLVQTRASGTVELLNYRKDGVTFWSEIAVSPVLDATGELTHFVGVMSDATARRALEEQFRQAQKMDAFGQLAGGVAHDFNNLLTIINGYSEMLLTSLPTDDASRPMVDEIHQAGVRSAGLTRQLLAFSRQQVLAPRTLDLNEVVADTDRMLRRLIGEDVRLATSLESQVWPVRADPGQVEQVLINLAVNARDAMPRGGRLTIETQNVVLDPDYCATHAEAVVGRNVLLSVSDSGCGMTAEVKAKVFEPFFTTKGPGKGTGLGLATVYGIVKQSGGHVNLYSELGIGTTFKVYLPRIEQPAEAGKPPSVHRPPPRGTETVLLAEDEEGVRKLAARVLTGCGYKLIEACDGEEAIRAAAAHAGTIHLLVSDVVMPGTGGRALAEELTKTYPGLKVLFMSGYTDDAVIRHGVLREAVNFLQKPFTAAGFAIKVRQLLDTAEPIRA